VRKSGIRLHIYRRGRVTGFHPSHIIKEGPAGVVYRAFFDLHFIKMATAIKASVDGAFPFSEPAALEPLYNADG